MAKLTAKTRNKLPGGVFALPGRRYPLDTPNRARNALARVSQHGNPEEQAQVRRKVHSKFPSIGVSKMKEGSQHGKREQQQRKRT